MKRPRGHIGHEGSAWLANCPACQTWEICPACGRTRDGAAERIRELETELLEAREWELIEARRHEREAIEAYDRQYARAEKAEARVVELERYIWRNTRGWPVEIPHEREAE